MIIWRDVSGVSNRSLMGFWHTVLVGVVVLANLIKGKMCGNSLSMTSTAERIVSDSLSW